MGKVYTLLLALVMALTVVIGYDSVGFVKEFESNGQEVTLTASNNPAEAHALGTCSHRDWINWSRWHQTNIDFRDHHTRSYYPWRHIHKYIWRHGWWNSGTYYVTCGERGWHS